MRYPARGSNTLPLLALDAHVKPRKFSHFARNRPFLPGFLVVSPQNQVKRQDSTSAECSNGNDHALIAARRTFPPVGPNSFIFYGRGGEIASNRLEDQELALLALHLLQMAMVYINTLMIQQVLTDDGWWARMTPDDLRALTPLMYAHITPYGTFKLDMHERLPLEAA